MTLGLLNEYLFLLINYVKFKKSVLKWMIRAYLRGEVENIPPSDTKAPRSTAKQITRAEVMLKLRHKLAVNDKGDRKRLKRAVYLKASGMRPRVVRTKTGLNYQQLWKAQKDACSDLREVILQLSQLRVCPNVRRS